MWVRSPAARAFASRSKPISAQSSAAPTSRSDDDRQRQRQAAQELAREHRSRATPGARLRFRMAFPPRLTHGPAAARSGRGGSAAMRAMQVAELGRPLALAEVAARRRPGPARCCCGCTPAGVNFADTLMAAGRYQEKPALPFTPGIEVCGTVEALGPGVAGPAPGTRVACFCGAGGLAEYRRGAGRRAASPAPEAMADAEVAGFLVAYGTSHLALAELARLRAGRDAAGARRLRRGRADRGGARRADGRAGDRGGARRGEAGGRRARPGRARPSTPARTSRAAVKALGGADVVYDPVGGAALRRRLRGGAAGRAPAAASASPAARCRGSRRTSCWSRT